MKRLVALGALLCAGVSMAVAQGSSVPRVCPIDGKTFTYMALNVKPSSQLNLDMKPADAFAPWPHPKCPENGFVIYKSDLSSDEIQRLRPFVLSEQYRAMSEIHSTHYLEAALRRHLGESTYNVAWALVQASWEVSSDPKRYQAYAEEALQAYESIKLETLPNIKFRILKRMMSGELLRRLGRFDVARERFLEMRDSGEFATQHLQRIIELQLKLVRAKDSGSHRLPSPN